MTMTMMMMVMTMVMTMMMMTMMMTIVTVMMMPILINWLATNGQLEEWADGASSPWSGTQCKLTTWKYDRGGDDYDDDDGDDDHDDDDDDGGVSTQSNWPDENMTKVWKGWWILDVEDRSRKYSHLAD